MKKVTVCAVTASFVMVAALTAVSAVPGVVFTLEVKTTGQPPATLTASINGANLKMEIPRGGGAPGEVIFRAAEKEMVMVDHGTKSYVVVDQASLKQIAGQMGAAMQQMQQQMKNLPPEQRAQMEQMMKGRGMPMPGAPPLAPAELRRTSERAKQGDYDTVKYEAVRAGKVIRALWVTDWSNVEGAAEARQAFEGMAAFTEELSAGLGPLAQAMPQNGFQNMKAANGFPVLTIEYDDAGAVVSETRLVSTATKSISADAFAPPAGYTRQSIGR